MNKKGGDKTTNFGNYSLVIAVNTLIITCLVNIPPQLDQFDQLVVT